MNSNSLKLLLPISLGVFAFAQIGIRMSPPNSQEHAFFAWLTIITLPICFIGLIAFFALRKQTIPAAQPTPTPLPPRPPQSATVHEIRIPRTTKFNAEQNLALLDQLISTSGNMVALNIEAVNETVTWRVITWGDKSPQKQIRSAFHDAEIVSYPYDPIPFVKTDPEQNLSEGPKKAKITFSPLIPQNFWALPIKNKHGSADDPLIYIANVLAEATRDGITAGLVIYIPPENIEEETFQAARQRILQLQSNKTDSAGIVLSAINLAGHLGHIFIELGKEKSNFKYDPIFHVEPPPPPPPLTEIQKAALEKLNGQALVPCYAIRYVIGLDKEKLRESSVGFGTAIEWRFSSGFNGLTHDNPAHPYTAKDTSITGFEEYLYSHPEEKEKMRFYLTKSELATLFHLPHTEFKNPAIAWIAPGRPSEAILNNKKGVLIGKSSEDEIRIASDGDPKHTMIIGETGTGKSTFMHNLVHHSIQAGKGVCVIDPHGKIVRSILECSIPDNRIDDVVLLDLANETYPPPLNPLALADKSDTIGIGQIMAVFNKIYNLESMPRATPILELALNTIKFGDKPTPRDAVVILRNPIERRKFLAKYQDQLDEASHESWGEFESMSSGQDALADPVVRRLRRFYSTNFMYAMFCHPDSLDFVQLIKQNKIILVSLEVDKAKVPPSEQQLLGALIVSQIELAARKAGKPKPVDFRLYVDEAKNFIATSLPDLFDEIRKYGVWVTIANQYLDQLKGKTLSAVMGNVTTTVAFSIGLDDASEIGQYMKPAIQPEDLLHLGVHRAAIRTILNNQAQPSFIVDTLPPPPAHIEGKARVERIKQRSIIQWTPKARAQVLAWLAERYPRQNLNIPKGDEPNKPGHDDDDFEVAG